MTWNYPDDYYCARCGCDPRESSAPPPPPESNTEDVDEFGRAVKKPEESLSSSGCSGKVPEWPPKFETNGSAFVFDARSGQFYEADSDFFYDPKTKLYYGNKKRAYYRYNEEARFPFEEVQKVDHASEKTLGEREAEPALAPIPRPGSSKDSITKGISIKLKTKSIGSSSKKPKTAPTLTVGPSPPSSRQQKQHVADMDKWADRQVEKRVDASQERTIKRTAKGEPICTLCKRKFPSVEKLLVHERVSNLHKDNLAKQAAGIQKASEEQAINYTDRAEQRRILHGPDIAGVVPPLPPVKHPEASLPITTPAVVPTLPQENLGETNIGNQLLQKMGWKEGKSLGRPVSSSSRESADTTMSGSIKKDWERIEALTATGGRAPSTGSKAGLGTQN